MGVGISQEAPGHHNAIYQDSVLIQISFHENTENVIHKL